MLDLFTGRRDEAIARMDRAFAVISADEPDEDLALLAARLSRGYWFSGDIDRAAERAELALDIAEAHAYPAALSHFRRSCVLNTERKLIVGTASEVVLYG